MTRRADGEAGVVGRSSWAPWGSSVFLSQTRTWGPQSPAQPWWVMREGSRTVLSGWPSGPGAPHLRTRTPGHCPLRDRQHRRLAAPGGVCRQLLSSPPFFCGSSFHGHSFAFSSRIPSSRHPASRRLAPRSISAPRTLRPAPLPELQAASPSREADPLRPADPLAAAAAICPPGSGLREAPGWKRRGRLCGSGVPGKPVSAAAPPAPLPGLFSSPAPPRGAGASCEAAEDATLLFFLRESGGRSRGRNSTAQAVRKLQCSLRGECSPDRSDLPASGRAPARGARATAAGERERDRAGEREEGGRRDTETVGEQTSRRDFESMITGRPSGYLCAATLASTTPTFLTQDLTESISALSDFSFRAGPLPKVS